MSKESYIPTSTSSTASSRGEASHSRARPRASRAILEKVPRGREPPGRQQRVRTRAHAVVRRVGARPLSKSARQSRIRSAISSGVSVHARSRDACSGNRGACSEYQCVCIPTAGMPTQATAAHTQHQQRTRSSSNFGNMLQPYSNLASMFVRYRGTRASGVRGASCRSARLASLRVCFLGPTQPALRPHRHREVVCLNNHTSLPLHHHTGEQPWRG